VRIGVPLVFLFMNSLFLIWAQEVYLNATALIPIALLSAVICFDVGIRSVSAKPDRYSTAILAISFLLFPLMVALPYFESRYLTAVYFPEIKGALLLAGLVIEVVGAVILPASRIQIGRFGGAKIAIEDNHRFVTDGMYRYVRNPQYLGMTLLLFGYALSLGGPLVASITVCGLLLIMRSRVRVEERLLLATFGDEYGEYMQRTW
jgi:protein-S-isoprenylcysteine O-methyltransferase Ste14